jgi:hypothetical protein
MGIHMHMTKRLTIRPAPFSPEEEVAARHAGPTEV